MKIYNKKYNISEQIDVGDMGFFADIMTDHFSGIVKKETDLTELYVRHAFIRNLEKLESGNENKLNDLFSTKKGSFLDDVFIDIIKLLKLDTKNILPKNTKHFSDIKKKFDDWEKGK